jgi:hypothetical protein
MNLRQRLLIITIIALIFLTFASYHEGTGGVAWLQFLSLIVIFFFIFIFDWAFTNESNFMFDPDADNWRRKVVSLLSFDRNIIVFESLSSNVLTCDRCFSPCFYFTGGVAKLNAKKFTVV